MYISYFNVQRQASDIMRYSTGTLAAELSSFNIRIVLAEPSSFPSRTERMLGQGYFTENNRV
jgi:hypothetical protein